MSFWLQWKMGNLLRRAFGLSAVWERRTGLAQAAPCLHLLDVSCGSTSTSWLRAREHAGGGRRYGFLIGQLRDKSLPCRHLIRRIEHRKT